MAFSSLSVAHALLVQAQQCGQALNPIRLQRLLYLADGVWTARMGRPLLRERPHAWQHGPIYPSVYHAFAEAGHRPIESPATRWSWRHLAHRPVPPSRNQEVLALLAALMATYGRVSTDGLNAIVRDPHGPWADARCQALGVFGPPMPAAALHETFSTDLSMSPSQA